LRVRVEQHRAGKFSGFTAKYGVYRLVWFEGHPSRDQAFRRERRIKEWRRLWKLHLIEARNPDWLDLYEDLDRLLDIEDRLDLPAPQLPLIPAEAGTQARSS
jgi:putative endonuclease